MERYGQPAGIWASIFFVMACWQMFAADVSENPYVPRALCIFLDDSEPLSNPGAVGITLLGALGEAACPLICSTTLLQLALSPYHQPYDRERIENAFSGAQIGTFNNLTISLSRDRYILLKTSLFDADKWYIKQINQDMYLLVPKNYAATLGVSEGEFQKQNVAATTDAELILGIKINHMRSVTIDDVLINKVSRAQLSYYFLLALEDGSIFCSHQDYRKKAQSQPAWTWYMIGHGEMKASTAGMSLADFSQMLDVIATKINMRLLMYSSCYGAGSNLNTVYQDLYSEAPKTYPFAIMTQAVTDAPVEIVTHFLLRDKDNNIHFGLGVSFTQFAEEAIADSIDYRRIKEAVFVTRAILRTDWSTVPLIRLPGLQWFQSVAGAEDVVSIGSLLAKARSHPLSIQSYFKTDPKVLLLYAVDVPFELVIDNAHLSAIISMIPGDARHKMKGLTSNQFTTDAMIDWFMQIRDLAAQKIFLIESLQGLAKDGSQALLSNVIVYNHIVANKKGESSWKTLALFTWNNVVYIKDPQKDGQVADPQAIKLYTMLLSKMQGRVETLKPIEPWFSTSLGLQSLTGNYRIPLIKISSLPLSKIIGQIADALNDPHDIVWVETMTGDYDRFTDLRLPIFQQCKPCTLQDVIVTNRGADIYLMRDGKFYHNTMLLEQDYRPTWRNIMSSGVQGYVGQASILTAESLANIKLSLESRDLTHVKVLLKDVQRETHGLLIKSLQS